METQTLVIQARISPCSGRMRENTEIYVPFISSSTICMIMPLSKHN